MKTRFFLAGFLGAVSLLMQRPCSAQGSPYPLDAQPLSRYRKPESRQSRQGLPDGKGHLGGRHPVIRGRGKDFVRWETPAQYEYRCKGKFLCNSRESGLHKGSSSEYSGVPGRLRGRGEKITIGKRVADDPNVGTIVLHRSEGVHGTIISITEASAPKDARKAFEKARTAIQQQKFDEAEKQLKMAVELYPKYADAWYELGRIQQRTSVAEAARNSYNQAIAADPQLLPPYQSLMRIAERAQNWQELVDVAERALKLAPHDFPEAWYYHAVGKYRLGLKDIAEKSARQGLVEDPSHVLPGLEQLLGVILYEKQDYAGALEHLHNCLKIGGPNTIAQQAIAAVEAAAAASKKR